MGGTQPDASTPRFGLRLGITARAPMRSRTAIGEANRVSVMLTTARAAYNRITYPERYT